MSDPRADWQQSVLDRGKFVWIVFGTMTDWCGARVLRVCTDQHSADEFARAIQAADPAYRTSYAKVPLDATCRVDLQT